MTLWLLFLCSAWSGAVAEIGDNMNDISNTLVSRMADVLEMATVNYSEPVVNTTYMARVEFDMRAMGPLYNSTHLVIDVIANKQAYPEGIVSVADGHVNIEPPREHWRVLAAHYAGPAAVLALALLLVLALPIAGLCWCCCYWCRVGRRRRPFDRKYDACLKGLLALLLIALLTLFLFGVVCAFATEAQVEGGLGGAGGAVRGAARDAREFLNATQAHARWLLVVNFRELEAVLAGLLQLSGSTVSVKLGEFSHAVSMLRLNGLVQQLDAVQADLRAVQVLTAALRQDADTLNHGLRKVRSQLLQTLAKCDQPKCIALQNKYKIGELDTEIQYSQMPDVTELLNNVTSLLDGNIKQEVAEGQKVFENIRLGIKRSVNEHIPQVKTAISETGRKLEAIADEITYKAGNASAALQQHAAVADTLDELYLRYGPYRRYVGPAAAALLLLVTALVAWGLVCGVCGKRPDVYGASDCCNKGAGSKCLLCAVGVIFLLGGAVALVLGVYFAVGVAAQRFVCDPLTEPVGNRLFEDLEKVVNLEEMLYKDTHDSESINMTYVMLHCHRNESMYQVLQLRRAAALETARRRGVEAARAAAARLRPALPARVAILRPAAKRQLRQLADAGLSDFDFERILAALETNMTSLALDALARQLQATARGLDAPLQRQAADLQAAARELQRLHADLLQPMLRRSSELNSTATRLRDSLRLNQSSLKEAILYLMHEITEAEVFFNTKGPESLRNMTREFAEVIVSKLDEYLERVVKAANEDVGRCGPLSNAFNSTRDAACTKILMPVNGYWMALAWCVVLFVPLLLAAQRLARLYLQLEPYPGPLVEAEYLYDAYADRDNVPLANGSKRSTLDIEGKIAEWRGRSAPSAPLASPAGGGPGGPAGDAAPSRTQLVLEAQGVVCALAPALMDDLKTRLDAKDEDNESGIHEAE